MTSPLSLRWRQVDSNTLEADGAAGRQLRISPGHTGRNYLIFVKHPFEKDSNRRNQNNWDPYNYGQQPTRHQAKRWAELLEHSIAAHYLNPSLESVTTFACERCYLKF